MQRRQIIVGTLVIILLSCLGTGLFIRAYIHSKLDRLELGMTPSQVQLVLGEPRTAVQFSEVHKPYPGRFVLGSSHEWSTIMRFRIGLTTYRCYFSEKGLIGVQPEH